MEEELKKIAELREILEERIKNLEAELDGMRALLDFVNNLLIERSFKKAGEIAKPKPSKPSEAVPAPVPQKILRTIPLKTASGELLANMYVGEDQISIVPASDKQFDVNIPPFTAFLVERIFAKMQEKDQELVQRGRLMPNEVFSYEIVKEGNILREIRIKNFDQQREREIRSATRWTLEKMYDKIRGDSQKQSSE
ncbi:hypothetical protein CW704_05385 [Candidatus Bathyarchaeota archaeon]|nr:hypothetical protein [Candidatus Bathyarchaeota archaeon]RJS86507.1 MAG: hypothetical protein CW704_05385 [Candidatus Bathyarchaeota archaeon]